MKKTKDGISMIPNEIYAQALKQWGKPMQVIIALEEMSELAKELTKNLRGKENVPEVCEEIADVEIMLGQMRAVFDEENQIDIMRDKKLMRLEDMLQKNPSASDVVNRRTGT